MQRVALVANGEIKSFDLISSRLKTFQRIVAIDGGLLHCHQMGVTPDFLIGDFDSCPKDLLQSYSHIPHQKLPKEKDLTDLEAALQFELREASHLTIFAGWGGRIDHALTHALILTRYPGQVHLETETEILFALEKESLLDCQVHQTLSLIPLSGKVEGITTVGLKWELQDKTLDANFIGISNRVVRDKVEIRFKTGSLLCCLQHP
jgi:thiamine pyrophosphokinase